MITDKKIEKLTPKSKRYTVKLGESLFLRVMPSGHKSYVLRYYSGGIVRDITLGSWPHLKVLQAVQAAHHKREELKIKPSKGLKTTIHIIAITEIKANTIIPKGK